MDNRKRPSSNAHAANEAALKRLEADKAKKEALISEIRNSKMYKITRIIALIYFVFLVAAIADLLLPYSSIQDKVVTCATDSRVNNFGEGGNTIRVSKVTTANGLHTTFESVGSVLYMREADVIYVYKSKIFGNIDYAEDSTHQKKYEAAMTIKTLAFVCFYIICGFFSLSFLLLKKLEYKGFLYLVIGADIAMVGATVLLLILQK